MAPSIKPELPHILTGDEWEAAQYAPHRIGQDPTKPMPAGRILTGDEWEQAQRSSSISTLKLPAMPKFAADATQRLNPNAGPVDKSVPEQMGAGVRNISAGLDAAAPGVPLGGGTLQLAAILGRQVVAPAVEHPIVTAAMMNPVGGVIGGMMAAHTVAKYGWQIAHESQMTPDERAEAQKDPNRVSGEAAAVQAVMLGLGGLAGVKALSGVGDVSAGVTEAGAAGVKATDFGLTPEAGDAARVANLRAAIAEDKRYFESTKGAEVLGTTAGTHGLPETASPYQPGTEQDVAWKQGHATVTAANAEPTPQAGGMQGESVGTTVSPAEGGPAYKGPASLYGRLSNDALGSEYRALLEKRTAEEPAAQAPLWTPEREAEAVANIENRRRPDGTLVPADKRALANLQAAQGEEYYVGRHTFESAAAERRVNEMTKHITAIEKEITNRGLNADKLLQQAPASGEGGSLASVEGTGELKTRGLSLSVEQTAIAKELTDYLGDLPQYRSVNMADQAARSTQLLADDPALARRVALGEVPAPHGILPESVLIAVEQKALAEGDVGTIRDLASGGLTEEATTMGQRIRALRDRDPDSPVVAIQRIEDARGGGKNAQAIADTVAEISTHLENVTKIEPDALAAFIDSLRC